MKLRLLVACIGMSLALATPATAKPPLDAFGDVPTIRAMTLSPDGSKAAFIQRRADGDVIVINDLATNVSKGLARIGDFRARYVYFAGNDYVVLVASKSTRTMGFSGRYEFSAALAFNINTGAHVQLLQKTPDIYPAQSGMGRIVGIEPGGKYVLMPAFMGTGDNPSFDLLRVPLDSGRGMKAEAGRGTSSTVDWLVNAQGRATVREEFIEKAQIHKVLVHQQDGGWKAVYENKAPLPEIAIVGLSADSKFAYTLDTQDSGYSSLFRMSLDDGTSTGPVLQRADADIDGVISNTNRVVLGVRYSGMRPSYEMLDPALEADVNYVVNGIPSSSVYLDSWSDDFSKLLFITSGGDRAERYLLFDRTSRKLTVLSQARPEITPTDVGEVITIEYKSRDGLKIPSLITWPAGVAPENRKNLPFVVMPHGGPESYDSVGFDWLAQFIANEGYAVLQPNFRGSSGFGAEFVTAGYGEWGRKMQDDITDGVNALVKMGWADPSRLCIVGWSYGGYAALQGAAREPDLYKCVASIAGVSNLRDMLATERRQHGASSRTVTYWKQLIGDPDKEGDAIDAVSPALHAVNFKAPVLLIHGTEDTTVPASQSDNMNNALKNANKQVQYIRIDGDDHSLVDNESRRKALTALGEFLKTYIGK